MAFEKGAQINSQQLYQYINSFIEIGLDLKHDYSVWYTNDNMFSVSIIPLGCKIGTTNIKFDGIGEIFLYERQVQNLIFTKYLAICNCKMCRFLFELEYLYNKFPKPVITPVKNARISKS